MKRAARGSQGAARVDDRREFLKRVAGTSALLMSARGLALAELPAEESPQGEPLRIGVIGCGPWGREILTTLARAPWATVAAVCDTYAPFLKRGQELAPAARATADARELLGLPEIEAVVIATPSHRHREIAIQALAAGKHVYCEAPLASTLEDARAIACGRESRTVRLPGRCSRVARTLLYKHVSQFVRAGVLGLGGAGHRPLEPQGLLAARRAHAAREAELNWRLGAPRPRPACPARSASTSSTS